MDNYLDLIEKPLANLKITRFIKKFFKFTLYAK